MTKITDDPASKYADKVDLGHKMAMNMVIGAYHSIGIVIEHLRLLDKAENSVHSFMHITDPTMYRDMINSKSFAIQMKIVKAALAFYDTVHAVDNGAAVMCQTPFKRGQGQVANRRIET
jgi:predicted transcriptional regulator